MVVWRTAPEGERLFQWDVLLLILLVVEPGIHERVIQSEYRRKALPVVVRNISNADLRLGLMENGWNTGAPLHIVMCYSIHSQMIGPIAAHRSNGPIAAHSLNEPKAAHGTNGPIAANRLN